MSNPLSRILCTIFTVVCAAVCIGVAAQTAGKYRFHCDRDTVEVGEMLDALMSHRDEPVGSLVLAAARLLEDRPYVAGSLEDDEEKVVIDVDGLDCVTFVENCYALALTVRSGGRSWREFARNIESLRYRHGIAGGYDTRLHYTTEWINDNVYRGNVTDVTPALPDARALTKSLYFMTHNRGLYPALADDSVYNLRRDIEMGLRSMRLPYITKEMTKNKGVVALLRDGDMVSFLSTRDGLDSDHVALLRIEDGRVYIVHASSSEGKVTFDKSTLYDYLKYRKRDCPGVRVVRLQ